MPAQIVLVTAGSSKEADLLAKVLVDQHFAACVTIIPRVQSVYRWKGRRERSREWLLVMKTTANRFKALAQKIRALHSYDMPEILALPVREGSAPYLEWLEASVRIPRQRS